MSAIVVNFFGGPGSGKSTLALGAASKLKQDGINCEYIHEFAKELTWDKRFDAMRNQTWILGSQYEMLRRCVHQVDVIITDTSLMNSAIYGQELPFYDQISELAAAMFNSMDNLSFFVERLKPYNPIGRSQDEDQAKNIDGVVRTMLEYHDIRYSVIPGNVEGESRVVEKIIYELTKGPPF